MRIFYKSVIFCLLILLNARQNTLAQSESLHFENVGMEEGLSSHGVTGIFQDRKGYIWVATWEGLNKYDGYSFTKYQFDPFDSSSISQNGIYTIWEDRNGDGSIWLGTGDGMCRFDRATEKFTRFKPTPNAAFADRNISAIHEDSDGMMWAGSFAGGLCRFDRKKGIFLPESYHIKGVHCIYKDRAGDLWIGNSTGLHKLILEKKTGQLAKVSFKSYLPDPAHPDSLSSHIVQCIFEDHEGILWMGTANGLNSFDRKTGKFKRYLHDPKDIRSISTNQMGPWSPGSIKEDAQGNLWIGTSKGLNKLSSDRNTFTRYLHDSNDPYSLGADLVNSLHIDSAGILYVGVWGGKLGKVNLNSKSFELRRHDPNIKNSLSNNFVTSLVEDAPGIVWIGTYGGGLNRWDKKTDQFTHFRHNRTNPKTLRSDTVMAFLDDRQGFLWVCNGEVLSRLNKQTGECIHYHPNEKDYSGHRVLVFSIARDREGFFWVGTGNGLKRFDEKKGEFVEHFYHNPADKSGISDYTAITLFADSRDDIWIGFGSNATDRYNKKTKTFKHYMHDARDSTSISQNIVKSIFEDATGNLWVGTIGGGFSHFNYQTENFTTFTNKHGLPDNNVYSIIADNKGQLWLGTSNGLSRFDPVARTFTNYDDKDGLQSNVFAAGEGGDLSKGSCLKSSDGTIYFGGNNGFNFFDPLQLKVNNNKAPVVITQFKLFDKIVNGATELKKILLDHDENYFSFEFASLSFYNPTKNQYRYILQGVDKDWVNSGSRRYVAYTNVDPGTYVFRVKGTNNDGVWNEEGTSITIIINPPWWRTWWAYTIYGLLLLAIIFAIYRMQRQRIIRNERQKTQMKELTQAKEIEKAYHELRSTQAQLIQSEKMASLGELTAGIAHEIQNPLNFVNNFSEVSHELIDEMKTELDEGDTDEAKIIASDIKQNLEKILHHGKRADAIVKGMLQHSRSSSGIKEPTDINALADEYLRLAYHGLRAKDKNFNATMQTDFDESIGPINIIPQDIGRVILNLITNAFYAVTEKKKQLDDAYEPTVLVSTKKIANRIEIKVKDNGNGIPQKVLDKIFQPFFTTKPTGQGTGLGLSLSYDIVKAHGGEIKVNTKEGEGTEFFVLLLSS